MKKLMVVSAVMMLLLVSAGFSYAMMCDKGMGGGMGMDGGHPMIEKMKSLGLDEKQTAEVKAVHLRVMKEMVKKRAEMQVARIELREILGMDPVDMKAAEAKIRQIEALRGDMQMMHIQAREEVKGKLSPEQRKKFEAMMPMMMHDGMMGGCGCGMPGKMKKGKGHGMQGKGMRGHDCDYDTFSEYGSDEMPAMGHQHMKQGK